MSEPQPLNKNETQTASSFHSSAALLSCLYVFFLLFLSLCRSLWLGPVISRSHGCDVTSCLVLRTTEVAAWWQLWVELETCKWTGSKVTTCWSISFFFYDLQLLSQSYSICGTFFFVIWSVAPLKLVLLARGSDRAVCKFPKYRGTMSDGSIFA